MWGQRASVSGDAGAGNPFAGPGRAGGSGGVTGAAEGASSGSSAQSSSRARAANTPQRPRGGNGSNGGGGNNSSNMSSSLVRRDDSMLGLGMAQEELLGHIQHNLTLIQNSLQLSVGMIDMVGTENDSTSLRKRINDVLGAVASKINRTKTYIRDMALSEDRKKKRGTKTVVNVGVRKKLEKDLSKLKTRLTDTERQMKLKERQFGAFLKQMEAEAEARAKRSERRNVSGSSSASMDSSFGDNGGGNPFAGDFSGGCRDSDGFDGPNVGGVRGLVTSDGAYVSRDQVQKRLQQQMLIEGETEVNEAMINERNSAMRKINRDLHEVREIFSDLATMVEDQDEAIETIADNVEKSAVAAEKGRKQLERANEMQRNRCAIC